MAAEESAAKAVVWCAAKGAVEAGGWTLACLALAHRWVPELMAQLMKPWIQQLMGLSCVHVQPDV